jgi:hypothetical protein
MGPKMPNLWLTPCAFLEEFNSEDSEFVKGDLGVKINLTNDFRVQPFQDRPIKSKTPKDVRHMDTSGRLLRISLRSRKKVIETNESRAMYRDFLKDVIDEIVPVPFLKLAVRRIYS